MRKLWMMCFPGTSCAVTLAVHFALPHALLEICCDKVYQSNKSHSFDHSEMH